VLLETLKKRQTKLGCVLFGFYNNHCFCCCP